MAAEFEPPAGEELDGLRDLDSFLATVALLTDADQVVYDRGVPEEARFDLELLGDVLDRIHIANQRQEADKVVALNRDFHFLIYRRINSPRRLRMIEQLWLHAERYQHMSVEFRHDAADEEHRQVINLLAAGDHSAAADAMRDHLTSTVNVLRTAFLGAGTRSETALDAGSR